MWPSTPYENLMSKLDAVREITRIAYGEEGENRSRLFATARDMLGQIAELIREEAPAPDGEEDE